MATETSGPPRGAVERLLGRLNLRFPGLFLLLLLVTAADFVVPDVIPFADEIVLALLTALFGLWKSKRRDRREPAGGPPARREPEPPALLPPGGR